MGSTKIELVNDLQEQLNRKNLVPFQRIKLEEMIERAKKGYYHDYESEIAMPKTQLHLDLLEIGFTAIDKKVLEGQYDE